jgi:hypothetical protein
MTVLRCSYSCRDNNVRSWPTAGVKTVAAGCPLSGAVEHRSAIGAVRTQAELLRYG